MVSILTVLDDGSAVETATIDRLAERCVRGGALGEAAPGALAPATSDRVVSDEIELTHDFLAHILHVRRASVTLALGELQSPRAHRHAPGKHDATRPGGLEKQACECYARVNEEYARLITGEPLAR